MNDLTFNILKVIISIAAALFTIYLIPYLRNKLEADKYNELVAMVNVAVLAAEQTIGSGQGQLKKAEVIAFVTNWMNEHKIIISEEQLSQIIEAVVFQMNKELK